MKDTMNIEILFCDTYALIEIIGGNKKYKQYTDNVLITSDYNLMELYYSFLRDCTKEKAEHYFNEWMDFAVKIPKHIIKKAMEIKLENQKEKLSYVDCIGYAFSLENDLLFLTGDSKFENKKGVEFVK